MKYAIGHLTKTEVKAIRKRLGLRQMDLAQLMDVSVKTVERWESGGSMITGPAAVLLRFLEEYPQLEESFRIPEKNIPCDFVLRETSGLQNAAHSGKTHMKCTKTHNPVRFSL